VALIQSSNPAYTKLNHLPNVNGFSYVLQSLTDPTQIAEYNQQLKGGSKPPASNFADLTKDTKVTIDAINSTSGFPYGWQAVGTQTADITIKVGTTVTWSNSSATVHNVYSGTGPSNITTAFPNSGIISPNVASSDYTYTFTKPGDYPYFCAIHPAMVGWITVVA
jgi:plastocyanin